MAFNNFPYTDLQDLNIDWLLRKMKEVDERSLAAVATANSAKEVAEALTNFVNNYFDNLDVQEEINNKIDDLLEAGAFDPIVEGFVPNAVSEWLSENITPTTPPVDPTLTVSGAAADAKVTGEKIGEISETTNNLFNGEFGAFSGMETNNGVVTNTLTDTRAGFNCAVRFRNTNTVISSSEVAYITENGRRHFTVTPSEAGNNIMVVHNGSQRNLSFTMPFDFIGGNAYTVSFNVDEHNPQVVGGIQISKIQIENGSEATPYTRPVTATDYTARTMAETNAANIQSLGLDIQKNATSIEDIKNNIHFKNFDTDFVVGNLDSGGHEATSTTRVRSGMIATYSGKMLCEDGYRYAVHYYNSVNDTYSVASDYWLTGEYTVRSEYNYLRFVVEKVPAATVTEVEADEYGNKVKIDLRNALTAELDELDTRVTALETENPLPDYWDTYLDDKIPLINEAIFQTGNTGEVFLFFTDYHYVDSEVNYQGFTWLPNILRRIKNECPIENFVFGGDIIDTEDTRAEALSILERFRLDYNFLGLKNINGNHDNNPYGAESLSVGDVYSVLFRGMGMEKNVHLSPNMYWYYDNETQKVRMIALNTGEGGFNTWTSDAAQHQWFINTLKNTPSGYSIVVLPHVFFGLDNGNLVISSIGENIKTIVDAYASRGSGSWNGSVYDFSDCYATIACILTGHTHNDGVVMSASGYPIIATVCDAMWGSNQNVPRGISARGTIAEHAFDIVCINTSTKTINCVRVGSGENRSFSYA